MAERRSRCFLVALSIGSPVACILLLSAIYGWWHDLSQQSRQLHESGEGAAWDAVHVFYAIFSNNPGLTAAITTGQLSLFMRTPFERNRISIQYITVGEEVRIANCSQCKYIAHYKRDAAMETLQHLYRHCLANRSERVIYMHTHSTSYQEAANAKLRRFATKAVASRPCLTMPETCNVCSARFSPLPHPHAPGNMWVASCEYVRRLQAPSGFAALLRALVERAGENQFSGRRDMENSPERFAAEHWVHSHPSVAPCDVFEGQYVRGNKSMPDGSWAPTLQPAPRFPLDSYNVENATYKRTTLLSWRLYEWGLLYDQAPAVSSFWWAYYGTGERKASPVAFQAAATADWNTLNVFYNVFTQKGQSAHTLAIVKEQLAELRRSTTNVPNVSSAVDINYVTLGQVISIPDCPRCKHLAHIKKGFELHTLQYLWEHCVANRSKSVAYMHTKGSFHTGTGNDHFRRFLTTAIFSRPCLTMPEACNVCSARFSPLPHPHTSGNFWVSPCEYIRRLVAPCRFEAAMAAMVAQAPMEPHPNREPWHLGLERYAAEHWVHSHPLVSPCDVYDGAWMWMGGGVPGPGWQPQLSFAPRFDMERFRLYLAYNRQELFLWRCYEWKFLYSQLPPASSFWWTHYSTGEHWTARAASSGSAVWRNAGPSRSG